MSQMALLESLTIDVSWFDEKISNRQGEGSLRAVGVLKRQLAIDLYLDRKHSTKEIYHVIGVSRMTL